ncbi:DUF899 family protein [Streptomyces antnestii]|uniref:DUF899 family protein n=1 Tax=Streptomyces antnestii TaxID=2494256 RepID=UPI001CB95102|nr:DUF899 family protein [Streptomyces sp. San01]
MSELFTAKDRPLIIYHFMYGKLQTDPCPMCTLWIDGFNGVAHHIARNGWHRLRLLSCGDSTFTYDMGSENKDGEQDCAVSVFTRDGDGAVRHFCSTHPRMADDSDQRGRGIELLAPVCTFST